MEEIEKFEMPAIIGNFVNGVEEWIEGDGLTEEEKKSRDTSVILAGSAAGLLAAAYFFFGDDLKSEFIATAVRMKKSRLKETFLSYIEQNAHSSMFKPLVKACAHRDPDVSEFAFHSLELLISRYGLTEAQKNFMALGLRDRSEAMQQKMMFLLEMTDPLKRFSKW